MCNYEGSSVVKKTTLYDVPLRLCNARIATQPLCTKGLCVHRQVANETCIVIVPPYVNTVILIKLAKQLYQV